MLIHSITELEEALSRPTEAVLETLRGVEGDVMVLGAAGKMGPSLARMARRALDALGQPQRRVFAVSRFSQQQQQMDLLEAHGVKCLRCDLLDAAAVARLPRVENVLFLAGQKFGTQDQPGLTWMMNVVLPAVVAPHFAGSRVVVFSTGCVYPLMPFSGPGATEATPLQPPGEYANTCVGRERIFTHLCQQHSSPALLFRLCYAIDLRYGVLVDLAQRVYSGAAVDVSMPAVQCIWQGDACARALQSLAHCTLPATALNVTGQERWAVTWLAERFAQLMDRPVNFTGTSADSAWLWDATRSYSLFGPPLVDIEAMLDATAHWVMRGGASLGKPTHFEVRDGRF